MRSNDLKKIQHILFAMVVTSLCAPCALSQTPQGTPAGGGPGPGPGRAAEPGPAGPPAVAPAKVQAFAGVWGITKTWMTTPVPPKGVVPFSPAYEARRAEMERMDKAGEVIPGRNAKCIPGGMPDQLTFGFRIEANDEYMTMIGGTGPTVRFIWLNKKAHTPDKLLFPTYGGESIAHFEDDALLIDTIGLNSGNELTYAMPADDEKLHMVERWKLHSPTELEITITIESPKALSKPWTFTNVYGRRALTGDVVYCDRPTVNSSLDLTPPQDGYIPPGAE